METEIRKQLDAKETFKKCGACSHTFARILNHHFGHSLELEELALNSLAGGIMNQGHQCGMIWGAALAVGVESYKRHKDKEKAIAIAVTATQHLIASFQDRSQTVNCKEILGYSISNVTGIVRLMFNTMITGMDKSKCFDLAEDWAPEAIESGVEGLNQEQIELTCKPTSCASQVVKRMGGTEEEMVMVAGFAGGLGLSGNACGALSAAIWMKTLQWCREHPGKTPSVINSKLGKKVLEDFKLAADGKMLCSEITGRKFDTINAHSEYIHEGGCAKLIRTLAES